MTQRSRNQSDFDELFLQKPGEDGRYVALWFDYMSTNMYISGYREALGLLVKYIQAERADNIIVYPVIFLCRHSVELALKECIIESSRFHRKEIPDKIYRTHDLKYLTDTLKKAYPNIMKDRNWSRHENFFRKWESADPDGMFGRYPRNTSGSLIKVTGNISILKIAGESLMALDTLEGLLTEIDEFKSLRENWS